MKKFTVILTLAGATFMGAMAQSNVVQSKLYNEQMELSPKSENLYLPKEYSAVDETSTAQVTFVTSHDPSVFYSADLMIYNADYTKRHWDLDFNMQTSFVATVPYGTYDILMSYTDAWTMCKEFFSIKELVVIDKDTTIEFSTENINKHIKFRPKDCKGNEFIASVVNYNTDENGEWYLDVISEGNISSACFRSTIVLDGYGEVRAKGYSMSGGIFQGSPSLNEELDFYISDISDRYTLLRSNIVVDSNNDIYLSKMFYNAANGVDSIYTVPENYKLYTKDYNLVSTDNSTDTYIGGYETYEYINNQPTNGYIGTSAVVLSDGRTSINYYIDAPASTEEDPVRYDILISPALGICELDDEGNQMVFPSVGIPVIYEKDMLTHRYIASDFYSYSPVVASNDLEVMPFYPGIEDFAYTSDDFEMSNYSTTPIVSFYSKHNEMQELSGMRLILTVWEINVVPIGVMLTLS